MSTKQICPQCKAAFEGRSNQLYCSSFCKQKAFHERQNHPTDRSVDLIAVSDKLQPTRLTKLNNPFAPTITAKAAVEIEKLRLENTTSLRRLEMEEREKERLYEQIREERQFEQERELAELNNKTESNKSGLERIELLARLEGLEKELATPKTNLSAEKEKESEPDDRSSGHGSGLFWGLVGAFALGAILKLNKVAEKPPLTLDEISNIYKAKAKNAPSPDKTVFKNR